MQNIHIQVINHTYHPYNVYVDAEAFINKFELLAPKNNYYLSLCR